MGEVIYGLDIDSDYGVAEVKKALIQAFYESHQDNIRMRAEKGDVPEDKIEEFTHNEIEYIVRLQFQRGQFDFDHPSKESLFYVAIGLVHIAKSFRSVDVICNSLMALLRLIDKLPSK